MYKAVIAIIAVYMELIRCLMLQITTTPRGMRSPRCPRSAHLGTDLDMNCTTGETMVQICFVEVLDHAGPILKHSDVVFVESHRSLLSRAMFDQLLVEKISHVAAGAIAIHPKDS